MYFFINFLKQNFQTKYPFIRSLQYNLNQLQAVLRYEVFGKYAVHLKENAHVEV